MSQIEPELDDDLEVDEGNDLVRTLRKQLKESNRANKALQEEVASASESRKKLAFIEADLPDNPQVEFYRTHYDGPLERDAIRQDALTRGFLTPDESVSQEVAAHEAISEAGLGAPNLTAPGSDDEMYEEMRKVKPGPQSSFQIEEIMRKYGRQTAKDFH